jgi:arylsulfatase A-like enzyme
MQVPLILRYPGKVRAGTATKRVVSQVDVFPTLLALTGLNKTIDNSAGRDFTPLLTQQSPPWSDKAYFEYITVRAVIDGDWKYVKRLFGEPSELYHLARDPNETLNLINHPEHRDVMSRLDKDLDAFFDMHASPKFDIWRGGTGKAILMYSNRNERFAEADPDWREPFIEQLPAFSDRP